MVLTDNEHSTADEYEEDEYEEDDYDENAIMPPTPGPWVVSDDSGWHIRISAPDPDPKNHMLGRLEVQVQTDDIDSRVSRANAYLMAAAPLLKDALAKALEQTQDGLHSSPCGEPDCWVESAEQALDAAHPPAGDSGEHS